MAILKALTRLTWAGKIISHGESFEIPDTVAASLTERGIAEALKEAEEVSTAELENTVDTEARTKELMKKTLAELKEEAESLGIDASPFSNKQPVIRAILAAE